MECNVIGELILLGSIALMCLLALIQQKTIMYLYEKVKDKS